MHTAPPASWTGRIKEYAQLVAFEHTIFALPFALSALLLAAQPNWPPLSTTLWVVLAMVGGRTFAMGINRIIDRRIDLANPRTAGRSLPAGRVKLAEAWALTVIALALMVFATVQLPPLCLKLLPLALVVLVGYSYVKRVSALAHLVLGLALGMSAIGGWVALTGTLPLVAIVFGAAVMFWVAGFDIIYACQDVTFDREYGLHSLPANLSIATALWLSRVFHVGTVLALWQVGQWVQTGWGYWVAVMMAAVMLLYEQLLIIRDRPADAPINLARVNAAFFTINGFISLLFLAGIFFDQLIHHRGIPLWTR